jgi:hypothetical protein
MCGVRLLEDIMTEREEPALADRVAWKNSGQIGKHVSQHGIAALAMPRDLAVCHEVGHAVTAAADGVTVARAEVFGKTMIQYFGEKHGRPLTRPERRRLARSGYDLASKHWGGFTTWGTSPFPTDNAGTYFNPKSGELPAFIHHIVMLIGGICGELMLYSGTVPEASSLDEIMMSQALCFGRTGSHEAAESLWNGVWRETCITIKRYEPVARKLIAAFGNKDVVEGPELHTILSDIGANEAAG